jgi:acyl dehydratase
MSQPATSRTEAGEALPPYHIDHIAAHVGRVIGITPWLTIDQERIDLFARVTEDFNPLHVDVAAAKDGPFGATIAHGFLTLSLLSRFSELAGLRPEGVAYALNYGFERVRFMAPVKVGARIRNRVVLTDVSDKGAGRIMLRTQNTVEIDGGPKPALVADWLGLFVKE